MGCKVQSSHKGRRVLLPSGIPTQCESLCKPLAPECFANRGLLHLHLEAVLALWPLTCTPDASALTLIQLWPSWLPACTPDALSRHRRSPVAPYKPATIPLPAPLPAPYKPPTNPHIYAKMLTLTQSWPWWRGGGAPCPGKWCDSPSGRRLRLWMRQTTGYWGRRNERGCGGRGVEGEGVKRVSVQEGEARAGAVD